MRSATQVIPIPTTTASRTTDETTICSHGSVRSRHSLPDRLPTRYGLCDLRGDTLDDDDDNDSVAGCATTARRPEPDTVCSDTRRGHSATTALNGPVTTRHCQRRPATPGRRRRFATLGDPDDDDDSVLDGFDVTPLDPSQCQDVDGDTCDPIAPWSSRRTPPTTVSTRTADGICAMPAWTRTTDNDGFSDDGRGDKLRHALR